MLKRTSLLAAACVAMFAVGCASQPKWIDNPESASDEGKTICATGVSSWAGMEAMTRTRAEADARTKLANVVKVKIDSMLKDWIRTSTDTLKPENTTSQQFTEVVARQVTQTTMVGAYPAKYYKDPKTKTEYCLMKLRQDEAFFKALANQTTAVLRAMERDKQEKLLKGKMDDAIKSLDKYIAKQK